MIRNNTSDIYQLQLQNIDNHFVEIMRPNQNDPAKSPEGGLKSNKNITSSVAFNIKTENDHRGQQQHHKSPDVSRPELRNTWRKAQMPYNKLPQVFSQQKQKKKYGGKVKQDTIQNLGKLVENSEYKQTQKYLQPLKPKQEKKQKTERNLFKPIQKMRDMVSKAQEQIKMIETITTTVKSGPRLSECIKLQIIKIGHNTGVIKKMLHVPTLALACVRQEPSTQKESRNLIRDWTNLWREKLSGQGRPFVNIYQVLYNYPQGAISVFISLLNLLDLTSTLPESGIRQIFIQLLKIIQLFYSLTQMHFGGLSPSQIMFTEDNKIKLSLGLFYHIPIPQSFSIYHIKATQKSSLLEFGSTKTKFTKTTIEKSNNLESQRSIDIFKLGLIALNCAIGKFQNFEQSPIIFEAIRYAFTDQGQKKAQIQNVCCILHSEQYLIQAMASSSNSQDKQSKKSLQKFISYLKLVKDRYSMHFINFLCQCLKINHGKRANLTQLINHTFIVASHDNENKTVKVQLANLLALSRNWNETVFQSATMQKFDSFIGYIRPILQKAGKQLLMDLVNSHRNRMYEIGKEVGINGQKLGKRIQELVYEILKK